MLFAGLFLVSEFVFAQSTAQMFPHSPLMNCSGKIPFQISFKGTKAILVFKGNEIVLESYVGPSIKNPIFNKDGNRVVTYTASNTNIQVVTTWPDENKTSVMAMTGLITGDILTEGVCK